MQGLLAPESSGVLVRSKAFSEVVSDVVSAIIRGPYHNLLRFSYACRLLCKSSNSASENTPSAKAFISAHETNNVSSTSNHCFPCRTFAFIECPCSLSSLIAA